METRQTLQLIVNPSYKSSMHSEQVISRQFFPIPGGRLDKQRPMLLRNRAPLAPLADAVKGGIYRIGKGGRRVKKTKDLFDIGKTRLHRNILLTEDSLSRQEVISRPVTKNSPPPTMARMSKTATPRKFREQFCERLRAARIAAGYSEGADFARALGILPNTYAKYETRSYLPNHLIPKVCELLDIEIDYLFTGKRTHGYLKDTA